MTLDEVNNAIKELKAQGWTEQDILGSFYAMFKEDKINIDELEALCDVLGYKLTEEFKNMSPEDQKTKGYEEVDEPAEGVSEDEVEDAKEIDKSDDEYDDESNDKSDMSEDDDEEKKVRKLYGYDN